ncbi:MAG: ROK family protein, partial [Gammaproteobacteria bacterium]|nr:ROK family protein [Gammaproteobacteria bacterium]
VIDPEMVVFGGGLSNIQQIYKLVPKMLPEYVFTDNVLTKISPPRFGDASGARGAACLWSLEEAAA